MGLKSFFKGREEVQCPLCGSTSSKPSAGDLRYTDLRQALVKEKEWLKAHGSESGIPDIADKIRNVVGDPMMPGLEEGSEEAYEDRRCAGCRSLLPPQFWRGGVATPLAITVAGAVNHGKTTWLMSVLVPPAYSRYSIVGFTDKHVVEPYRFVEPYTMAMLDPQFPTRTSMPLQLMGCTIHYDDMLVDVRTLDVRGELFRKDLDGVSRRIVRNITGRRGGGVLMLLDKFTTDTSERLATMIARTYLSLALEIKKKQRRDDVLWKAVVWTFLDEAAWNAEGEAWLRASVSKPAPFLAVAQARPAFDSPDLLALYDDLRAHDDLLLRELLRASRDSEALRGPAVEGIVALLFHLQLLYSAAVARKGVDRLKYYYSGEGEQYVQICQELARRLYIRWDSPIGGVSDMLKEDSDEWLVIPCGRIMDDPNTPESVWSDQIVIQAVTRVTRRR